MAGRYELYEKYYGKAGFSSSAPRSKWGAPRPKLGASNEGGEGWVSWGLGLVGAGSAKKKPEVPLHADGNPLHWARVYYPLQERLSSSSSTGIPAPQQQREQPSAAHQTPTSSAHQTPTSSGTSFFNQPSSSNYTGNTNMSWKEYRY